MAQRKYDQALKDQAIEAVVKHGRSVAQTARDLDIAENTLYAMVAAYKRKNDLAVVYSHEDEHRFARKLNT